MSSALRIRLAAAQRGAWPPLGGKCRASLLSAGGGQRSSDVLLDPNDAEIIDGNDCEGERYRLIDVLTHELGFAYGLKWTVARGCAMSSPEVCKPVLPTAAEVEAAQ